MKIEDFNGLDIQIDYKDIVEASCKEAIKLIHENYAKTKLGGKEYVSSWDFEIEKDGNEWMGTVFNRDHYRLTHLLEKGHNVRNQYGKPKRKKSSSGVKPLRFVAPRPHIEPSFEVSSKHYEKNMQNAKVTINMK